MSQARLNYHEESEQAVNEQINVELKAFYAYLSMASWCNRDDVALPGLSEYFHAASREEHEHALRLIEYQAKRGGRTVFPAISMPAVVPEEWKSAVACLEASLQLEKEVMAALLRLHACAEKHADPQLEDFIEQAYLEEQVDAIKEVADLLTQVKRVGSDGLGLYLFDQQMGKLAASKK